MALPRSLPSFQRRLVRGLLLAYLALAAVALVVVTLAAQTRRERDLALLEDRAVEIARTVDAELRIAGRSLAALGGAIAIEGDDQSRLRREAKRLAEGSPLIRDIVVGREDGRLLVHTFLPADELPESFPSFPRFRQILDRLDRPFLVTNRTYWENQKREGVSIVAPVERGGRDYIIATEALIDVLEDRIRAIDRGTVALMDGKDQVLVAAGPLGATLGDALERRAAEDAAEKDGALDAPGESEGPTTTIERRDGLVLVGAPLSSARWRAVAAVPASTVDGPFWRTVAIGGAVLLFGLALLGAVLWLLLRPFLREIGQLAVVGDPAREPMLDTFEPSTEEGALLHGAFGHYRAALEAARVGRWEWDVKKGTLRADPRLARLIADRDRIGLSETLDLIDPRDRNGVRTEMERIAAGTADELDVQFRVAPDGQARWLRARSRVSARTPDGAPATVTGMTWDITSLRTAQQRSDLLVRELNHRVKNLFAVIGSIVSLSGRSVPEARGVLNVVRERVNALALAHTVGQGRLEEKNVPLGDIARATLAPYDRDAVEIEGPEVALPFEAVTPMGLILHELMTNAVKYGALSVAEGRVSVRWTCSADDIVSLEWRETGGPLVAGEPSTTGFGSIMLRQAEAQLGADVATDWREEGLHMTLTFPLHRAEGVAS